MKDAKWIVFRYITTADFFNINKPTGTEVSGGGQSYIDFPTQSIPVSSWENFFYNPNKVLREERTQGPVWTFEINSTGLGSSQDAKIYQRRIQSVTISSQKIFSKKANRVHSWHPDNGFPMPDNPNKRSSLPGDLAIYIIRTKDDEYWAGWFMGFSPCKDEKTEKYLEDMLINPEGEGYAGMIEIPAGELLFDINDKQKPFTIYAKVTKEKPKKIYIRKVRTEQEIIDNLFSEDESDESELPSEKKEIIQKVRKRNAKAVKDLKELYQGECQISGEKYTFYKKNGSLYSEAHHLLPLGNDGADSAFNIVILSPLIHKMLHYADVSDIDLKNIGEDNTLRLTINKEEYNITWHPKHLELVKKYIAKEED